jgi:hypothetical protein
MKNYCNHPFRRIKIQSDGTCGNCCFMERGALGNILTDGYKEVWNSMMAMTIREKVQNNLLPIACQTDSCPYAHLKSNELEQEKKYIHNIPQFPTEIELDLPDSHCNVGGIKPSKENPACFMCERHIFGAVQLDRTNEICEVIKPYIKYINQFHIQGIAEVFWKDKIFELFDLLEMEKYKEKLTISTTTNATILSKERRKKFLEYPSSGITFSVDAATAGTFKLIRRWDMFEKVVETIKNYCEERNSEYQKTSIHNNINIFNVNEVEQMVELGKECGVDRVDFNPTYGLAGVCVNSKNVHLFAEAQEKIIEKADEIDQKVTFMRNLTLDIPMNDGDIIQVSMKEIDKLSQAFFMPVQAILELVNKYPKQFAIQEFKPFS